MNYNDDLNNAIKTLKNGGLILYPTDTIWGLGCDCTNRDAINRIFQLKKREDSKSMILLADSIQMIERYVQEIPDIAYQLTEVSEKPLTIIYPKAKLLPETLIADDGSIAFRISTDPFSNELVERFRRPIVSTSANISGQASPSNFGEIDSEIISSVDYVVEHRQTDESRHKSSSIIKLGMQGEFKIIRE